jgi:hypothetical protein
MAARTQTQADRELNWIKGTNFSAALVTIYLAAMNTVGTLASAGTEVTGGSYARVAITTATGWSAIQTGTGDDGNPIRYITNAADLTFPTCTADWGYVPGWELYDASTVGNRLYFGALDPAQYVVNTGILKILAGTLRIAVN